MQQAELEQLHQENANVAALAALGPRRPQMAVSMD